MESTENVEEDVSPLDVDAASASVMDDITKDTVEDSSGTVTKNSDMSERCKSSIDVEQDIDISGSDRFNDNVFSFPESRTDFQFHQERMRRGSMSDDSDLGHLYHMSSHRFMGSDGNQECHYDDLPLVFSLPNCEEDSSKVYSCNICNFKTAFKNSLVNHQAVHSDARPWVCDVCDYAAKRKQDLKKHLQTMHGMIVDSLSLRPGTIPQTSCVSSSDVTSPVDVKPVIVNNTALPGEPYGAGRLGRGISHSANSSSFLALQQTASGFRHPLQSSTKLCPASRPVSAMGKGTADQFPFNQFWGVERMANKFVPGSSTETLVNHFSEGLQEELGSEGVETEKELSDSDNFVLQKLQENDKTCSKGEGSRQNNVEKLYSSSLAHSDQDEVRKTIETLPKTKHRVDLNSVTETKTPARDSMTMCSSDSMKTDKEKGIVADGFDDVAVANLSQSERMGRRWKRTISDSCFDNDKVPTKVIRFQSPQVSSQSDHSGHVELISSTDSHSYAPENRKSFHCSHCDILFFESAMYLMHMGLHDNTNPWKCSICGRTFFEKYSFTSHFINQH